jgi:nitrogen fixation protein NifU and related proteins
MYNLYQEQILDHANNPRNKIGQNQIHGISDYVCGVGKNPSCGDQGNLYIRHDNNIIEDIKFTGEGCAISQAGMSMITEHIKNKNINDLKKMTPGEIYNMLGLNISPARAGCALLCYNALEDFLKKIN